MGRGQAERLLGQQGGYSEASALAITADEGDRLSRVKADDLDQRIAQRLGRHRLPIVQGRPAGSPVPDASADLARIWHDGQIWGYRRYALP